VRHCINFHTSNPMRKSLCSVALCLLLVSCSQGQKRPPELSLNQARFGHVAALVGDEIYVLAGRGKESAIGTIERVNAKRKKVETIPGTVTPRYWLGGATDGTTIYLAGGLDNDDKASALLEAWRPGESSARVLAPMPEARSRFDLILFQNRLYAIGGTDAADIRSRRLDIYDIATDKWSRGADMPYIREGDAELLDDRIIVPGGYGGEHSLSGVLSYDPKTNAWSENTPLDLPQSAHSIAVMDGTLYVFGHYNRMDRVTARDPKTGSWSILDLPFSLARHTDSVSDGKEIFVIGGSIQSRSGAVNLVQRFPRATLSAAARRAPTEKEWVLARTVDHARLDPATEEVVSRWGDTLARLPRLTLSRQTTLTEGDGKAGAPEVLTLQWQPSRIFIADARRKLAFDGAEVRSEFSAEKAALAAPAASAEAGLKIAGIDPASLGFDVTALAGPDIRLSLKHALLGRDWRIQPATSFDGAPCWVLAETRKDSGNVTKTTLHVRQDDGLILRQLVEIEEPGEAPDAKPKRFLRESVSTKMDTGTEIAPEVFAWQPDKDLKRIADPEELRQP
jgi:hypothetical protein